MLGIDCCCAWSVDGNFVLKNDDCCIEIRLRIRDFCIKSGLVRTVGAEQLRGGLDECEDGITGAAEGCGEGLGLRLPGHPLEPAWCAVYAQGSDGGGESRQRSGAVCAGRSTGFGCRRQGGSQ